MIKAQGELFFLDLGPTPNILDNVDDGYSYVSLPSQLYFGSTNYNTSYVCERTYLFYLFVFFQISSNGLVSFGMPYTSYIPKMFPIVAPVVAPFWDDIDLTGLGNMSYNIFTSTSSTNAIQQVNNFISSEVNLTFSADWILVVQWLNVCPYSNSRCNGINVSVNIFCTYHVCLFYSLTLFNLYWLFKARKHMQSLHTSVIKYNGLIIKQLLGLVLMTVIIKIILFQEPIMLQTLIVVIYLHHIGVMSFTSSTTVSICVYHCKH